MIRNVCRKTVVLSSGIGLSECVENQYLKFSFFLNPGSNTDFGHRKEVAILVTKQTITFLILSFFLYLSLSLSLSLSLHLSLSLPLCLFLVCFLLSLFFLFFPFAFLFLSFFFFCLFFFFFFFLSSLFYFTFFLKENEKISKYLHLARELKNQWTATMIPIVVGTLETEPKD